MNFDGLCEVLTPAFSLSLAKFQYFWQPFWILPLKNFPQGGLSICYSQWNSATYEPFSSFVRISPGFNPISTRLASQICTPYRHIYHGSTIAGPELEIPHYGPGFDLFLSMMIWSQADLRMSSLGVEMNWGRLGLGTSW